MNTQGQTMTCPHCGSQIEHHQYLMREDGSERCVHCYFQDTYLSGIVDAIETSYLVTLEAFVSAIDAREHEVGNHSLRVRESSTDDRAGVIAGLFPYLLLYEFFATLEEKRASLTLDHTPGFIIRNRKGGSNGIHNHRTARKRGASEY